ncbi:MAG: PKD domain-containing protein [Vicingaceae bacterium]|nr:PKD domain-containing protein [Vicingaceae bacterium]
MKTIATIKKRQPTSLLKKMGKQIALIVLFSFASLTTYAQCTAAFISTDNGNGNYTFTSTSTGTNANTTYHWSITSNQYIYLGNSSNSVSYTFINGSHTVRLMISDSASNCNDVLTQTINVTSGQNCNINAGFTYTMGTTVNGSVNFQSTTTGNFASELWVYGDNSWGASPNHTYWSNGSYMVSLIARDASQTCFDTTQQTITISNISSTCNPSLNFSYIDNGNGNFSFSNTSNNYNPSGYFYWNFGNGQTSWNLTPSNTYTTNGTYNVRLIYLDSLNACIDTLDQQITVTGVIPPCTAVADYTYLDNGFGNFSFTSTSTGGLNHYWQFGDGNNAIYVNNPNHTFAANGTYNVVLHIFDSLFTCYKWKSYTIIVNGVNGTSICNAGYTMYLDSITNNIIVTNSSTGPNLSYFWNFGDGNTSTQAYPSYTYSTPGPFYLCLTVSDSVNSCTSTYCDSIGSNGVVLRQTGFTINVQPANVVGIEEHKDEVSELTIYPNPFKETMFIDININVETNLEVFVTDLVGNTVGIISNKFMNAGSHKLQWNPEDLSNGIYLLNVKTNNALKVKKLVLNK